MTINNFFESSYTQIYSSSSSSRSTSTLISTNPPYTFLPYSSVFDEIAYNEYLKNSFPSLPAQSSSSTISSPTPSAISANFKTDEAISNLFTSLIKNLQGKITIDNQNIITNTQNSAQSSTKTSFVTQTTSPSTPTTTSSTKSGNSTNSTSRPNIGSKIN